MAIKYTRQKDGRDRPPCSYDPPRLFGFGGRANLKRRLLFIYVGIGAMVFALSLVNIRDRLDTFEKQPELRGAAVITAKGADDTLILDLDGIPAEYKPDPQTFERLKPGDRVAVLYQRSRSARQIRILEIGTAPIINRP